MIFYCRPKIQYFKSYEHFNQGAYFAKNFDRKKIEKMLRLLGNAKKTYTIQTILKLSRKIHRLAHLDFSIIHTNFVFNFVKNLKRNL